MMKSGAVAGRPSRWLSLTILLAACGPTSAEVDGGSTEHPRDASHTEPDADVPCEPPFNPGRYVFTRTWSGARIVSLAIDADGGVIAAGKFTGPVDLDPGPGTMMQTAEPFSEQAFIVRLTPDGSLDWARVLQPRLALSALTVSTEGLVVLAGTYLAAPETMLDVDPGPAVVNETLGPSTTGLFVIALNGDASYAWSRVSGPSSYRGAVTGVAARPDGGVVVSGGGGGAVMQGGYSPGPDARLEETAGFLMYLDRDGTMDGILYPANARVESMAIAPDGSAVVLGKNWFTWDADYTLGIDEQESSAVFGVLPAYAVTMIGSDLAYRWTRTLSPPIDVSQLTMDADHNVYLAGGVDTVHTTAIAVDLDPGPEQRWLRPQLWASAWDASGTYVWAGAPLTAGGLAMQADEHGFYVADRVVAEPGLSDRTLAQIGAFEPSGRRRYALTFSGTGTSFANRVAVGPRQVRAIAGMFNGTIDPAFGGALPDPHVARSTDLPEDTFVTVFVDEGGSAPRCVETPVEPLPHFICPPTRNITCSELGAECGTMTDPCVGGVVHCGECAAPETCGGGGEANRCGRPAPLVVADGLKHPMQVGVDAEDVYFTTYGDYGPLASTDPDAGVRAVEEAMRLWRVARAGGTPELLYEDRSRPFQILVGTSAVIVAVERVPSPGVLRGAVVSVPKSDPASAHDIVTSEAVVHLHAADAGELFFDGSGLMRMPEDGSAAARVYVPAACGTQTIAFHGGEVFYDCISASGSRYYEVRSMPRDGGSETVRAAASDGLRLRHVDASGIYVTARDTYSADQWFRAPIAGSIALEHIAAFPAPLDYVLGDFAASEGDAQLFVVRGARSAETTDGIVYVLPLAGTPPGRLARGLSHPRSITLDGAYVWITEEGSYAASGATGRILRVSR